MSSIPRVSVVVGLGLVVIASAATGYERINFQNGVAPVRSYQGNTVRGMQGTLPDSIVGDGKPAADSLAYLGCPDTTATTRAYLYWKPDLTAITPEGEQEITVLRAVLYFFSVARGSVMASAMTPFAMQAHRLLGYTDGTVTFNKRSAVLDSVWLAPGAQDTASYEPGQVMLGTITYLLPDSTISGIEVRAGSAHYFDSYDEGYNQDREVGPAGIYVYGRFGAYGGLNTKLWNPLDVTLLVQKWLSGEWAQHGARISIDGAMARRYWRMVTQGVGPLNPVLTVDYVMTAPDVPDTVAVYDTLVVRDTTTVTKIRRRSPSGLLEF